MKKADDDKLFRLVQSMSEDESAFFKKHFLHEANGAISSAGKLFELLREAEAQDESSIMKKLEIKPKSLAVIKSRLYSDILDSLRISFQSGRPERVISIMTEQAEILIGKGLFREAHQLLLKAEEQAKQCNAYYHLGIVKSWMIWLQQFLTDDTFHEKTSLFFDEIFQNAQDILTSQKIYSMYLLSTSLVMKGNFGRNAKDIKLLNDIAGNELFRSDELPYPHKSKAHLLVTKAHYYFHKGEFEKSYHYSLSLWNEINSHQKKTGREDSNDLLNACMELIMAACNVKKFGEAKKLLNRFNFLRKKFYPETCYYEGICLLLECQIKDLDGGIKADEPQFKRLLDFRNSEKFTRLPPMISRNMDFIIADIFFSNKRLQESIAFSEKLASEKSTSLTRTDTLSSARTLHLMALFETEYQTKGRVTKCTGPLLRIKAKQYYETVRKLEDNYAYEKLVFRFFMNLPEKIESNDLIQSLKKLNSGIEQLKSIPGNEYIRLLHVMLDFQKWISQKLSSLEQHNEEKSSLKILTPNF